MLALLACLDRNHIRSHQNVDRVLSGFSPHVISVSSHIIVPPDVIICIAHTSLSFLFCYFRYDDVYDEDLPGLLCVKSKFWDKGVGDVMAFIRRRTAEGEWLWLESKAVSYVSQPVAGIILHEKRVKDEAIAEELNRVTRVTAIVVQAVEAAKLKATETGEATVASMEQTGEQKEKERKDLEAKKLMEQIMGSGSEPASKLEQELLERMTQQLDSSLDKRGKSDGKKESFDPFSMMETVREGVRLDLGSALLSKSDVTMVALVLTGKVTADKVCPLVLMALRNGQSIEEALAASQADAEASNQTMTRLNALLSEGSQNAISLPPPISVLSLSYTYIGNKGIDLIAEIIFADHSTLKTIDLSFCGIEEKGFISFSKAIQKRKRKGIRPLKGILLSGNYLSSKAAAELGTALSPVMSRPRVRRRTYSKNNHKYEKRGDEIDDEDGSSESDEDGDFDTPAGSKKSKGANGVLNEDTFDEGPATTTGKGQGLELLHLSSTSLSSEAINQLLHRLGPICPIRELNLASNKLGPEGTSVLVDFLQGAKNPAKRPDTSTPQIVMPFLDRLDLSNNNLEDDGCSKLTRAIQKRAKSNFVELKLSSNDITGAGIETMMNKLLQHNLVSLSLDKNSIGDQGCQLVAASLQSMKSLARLNLGFNQIGSRGIGSLMRSLVACESITYLELSGNVLKISGAVALAFTLAQHPRLEELDLDDCCLGQAAQCHIVAGIISNRWVPMKRLNGFAVGPPMVEIGALDEYAQSLTNEECFRIRKDDQMKTILQWMESNRAAKQKGPRGDGVTAQDANDFLTPDYVSGVNEVHGAPSQNAYLRLLGWLSRIPFDEDELSSLQRYFYDVDAGDGDKDGVNLKLRGDLLAALDSDVAHEIRDEIPVFMGCIKGSVGLDLNEESCVRKASSWGILRGDFSEKMPELKVEEDDDDMDGSAVLDYSRKKKEKNGSTGSLLSIMSGSSAVSGDYSESEYSQSSRRDRRARKKPRITMFPMFKAKLEELKATAAEMIELEEDPDQQEVILTQYAEASLTILRQLRYHCMNSGLDGWRHGGLKRKVLIVDDSNVTRKLVARAFEKANFIADTAANGAEGVEKLKKSIYDIAFMDIDMPVMNGFEATKKLRLWEDKFRPGARQPICALTAAYVDDFERSQLMKFKEAGLDVMESKPCNIPRLFKVVDDVSPMFSDLSISVTNQE